MLDDFEDASLSFQGLFCTSKGNQLDQNLVNKVLNIVINSKLSLSKNRFLDMVGNNASDVFRKELESNMNRDEELSVNRPLVYALFDWFLRYETIENCCDSMDEVSIASYTDWTDLGDGILLNFRHGYRSLINWFCNHFPSRKWIHLDKQVTNIEILNSLCETKSSWIDREATEYSRPILIRFISEKKDGNVGLIECNHVIVTASLGYLKKNHETMFEPRLPLAKRDLIESIGFGTVNKIILEFERPFWNDDHGIKLIWEEEDYEKFPTWVHDIIAFDVVRRQPNLLIGWIGGRGARLMENETDANIAETCIKTLNRFLPVNYNKPTRLIGCICSRWNSNPFVCGSYSFQSINSFNQRVEKLHEPLYNPSTISNKLGTSGSRIPRVLFAGEATAGKLYSTTHGAIISGWREAERLKDHLSGSKMINIEQQVGRSNRMALNF